MVLSLVGLKRQLQIEYQQTGSPQLVVAINVVNHIISKTGIDYVQTIPIDKICLNMFENKKYSQSGEDGITEKIFEVIGTTNKFYLDFGGTESTNNSEVLHKDHGFTGVLWNGSDINCPYTKVYKEFITTENILDLMNKYEIPKEFDFLSIDIDGNDWYVWKKICENYRPRVVVIEYNSTFPPPIDKIIKHDSTHEWNDGSIYFGATIQSMYNLGKQVGYDLVAAENMGANLFFIRNDIDTSMFHRVNDVEFIYRTPKYGHRPCSEDGLTHTEECLKTYRSDGTLCHKPDLLNREWISSESILNENDLEKSRNT